MELVFNIQKKHFIEILIIISKNNGLSRSDLYAFIGTNSVATITSANKLIDLGLIEENKKGRYNKKELIITQKGINLLKKLGEIENILL